MHFLQQKNVAYSDTDDEESHPRAKGDILGYSNEDNGDGDDGDDDDLEKDEGTEEKLVISDTPELTLLLDEMLDRELAAPIKYKNLNSLIVIPDKSNEEEEEEEEDEVTRAIKDTVDHAIQHDNEELSDLHMELRDEFGSF